MHRSRHQALLVSLLYLLLTTTQSAWAEVFSSASWADREKIELESERQGLLLKQQKAQQAKEKAEAARQYAIQLNDLQALPFAERAMATAEGALTRIAAALRSRAKRLAAVQHLRSASGDKPRAVASRLRGEVSIKNAESWKTFTEDTLLNPGQAVHTGADGYAELMFNDGSRINLDANSSFMLESANVNTSTYRLTLGRIKAYIRRVGSRRYVIRTSKVAVAVRGTEFVLETNEAGASAVVVLHGEVAFGATESKESVPVRGGELAILGPDGTLSGPDAIDLKYLQNWWE